jgi:protein-disulfide isomerase
VIGGWRRRASAVGTLLLLELAKRPAAAVPGATPPGSAVASSASGANAALPAASATSLPVAPTAAIPAAPAATRPDDVAASIGERKVRVAELDARCGARCADLAKQVAARGKEGPGAQVDVDRVRTELDRERRRQLEALVDEILWQSEADARGITVRALRDQIRAGAPPISDAEVARFYSQQAKPGSRSAEKQAERVRPYLRQRAERAAEASFLDELRARYPVKILLAAPEPTRIALGAGRAGTHGPVDARVKVVLLTSYRGAANRDAWASARALAEEPETSVALRPLVPKADPAAFDAAAAVLCAAEQQRSWELQHVLASADPLPDRSGLLRLASSLGLDATRLASCIDGASVRDAISTESADAERLGLGEPPTLLIDGLVFAGTEPLDRLRAVVAAERAGPGAAPGERERTTP